MQTIFDFVSFTMANDNQTVITNISSSRSTEMNNNNNSINKCMPFLNSYAQNQTGPKIGSCSLKRKRPTKLEIPNVLREICTDGKLDCSTTQDDAVCFSAPGAGVFSLKGKKKFMEDTHKVVSCPHAKKGFFGVYDGHGGNKAAEFVAENLHSNIYEMLENCCGNEAKEEAVKAGYLKTDREFLKQGLGSGACCVTALIEGKEILVSNLGDCRAVLCRGGTAEALTKDHRAGQEDERRRIEDQGGYVEMHRGAWRIHGILSVSRSVGDAHLKDWVPAEPDTKTIHLTSDMEYLILASDGLWEEVGNQEAVNIVMQLCSRRKRGHAILKENADEFGCISPLSRSRRVVLVKCKRAGHSPCSSMKTVSRMKESEDNFGSENESPPSKARCISDLYQTKVKVQLPNKESSYFKARSISVLDQAKMKVQSPNNENRDFKAQCISEMDQAKMKVQSPNKESSDFKARRISEMDQAKMKVQSPHNENGDFKAQCISEMDQAKMKILSPNKENGDFKAQCISEMDQAKMKILSPNKENSDSKEKHACHGLVAACKELVNLAVTRGSLDDITVTIIDLKQFM